MKFKSALLTQASGSVGGLTFSHNQGGLYTRARSIPVNTNTPLQQTVRLLMGAAQSAWRELTAAVRSDWAAYATGTPVVNSLGDTIKLTGLMMFLRQFVSRGQAGVTQITTAPPTPGLAILSPVSASRHLSTSTFDIAYDNGDAWAITTGGFLAVFQSPPMGVGNNFYKGPFRYVGKVLGNTATPPTSPLNVTSPYTVEAGQRYFFRAIAVDSEGRMSGAQFLKCDVA